MLSILRSNQPIAVALIPVTAGLLFLVQFFLAEADLGTGYHGWLPSTLNLQPSVWLHFGFITICAFMLNRLFNRHELGSGRNNLAGWMLVFAAACLPVYGAAMPFWMGLIPFLSGLDQTLKVYRQNDGTQHYFDAGFLFGVAAVCWSFFAIGGVLLIVAVLYTRAARWRELLLPGFAFVMPAGIFFTVLWLFDIPLNTFSLLPESERIPLPIGPWLPLLYWAVLGLIGAGFLFSSFGSSSNKSKNSKAILFLFALGASLLVFVFGQGVLGLNMALLPICLLSPWVFQRKGTRLQSLLFFLFVAAGMASFILQLS